LMCPFAPFLSESLYQGLRQFDPKLPQSVHLSDYPTPARKGNEALEEGFQVMKEVIILGRQRRNQVGIKVKTPLASLTLVCSQENILREVRKLEGTIQEELNVKKIHYDTQEEKYIELLCRPNLPVLGKKYGKDLPRVKKALETLKREQLLTLEKGGSLTVDGLELSGEDVLVSRKTNEKLPNSQDILAGNKVSLLLDTTLNEDLIQEGLAREIVNRIQKTRKDKGLNISDRIKIYLEGPEKILKAFKAHQVRIVEETLAQGGVTFGLQGREGKDFDFEDEGILILDIEKH